MMSSILTIVAHTKSVKIIRHLREKHCLIALQSVAVKQMLFTKKTTGNNK